MTYYSIVYICPGSGDVRTETFSNCVVDVVGQGCLRVSRVKDLHPYYIQPGLSTEMLLPPGRWFSVRRLDEGQGSYRAAAGVSRLRLKGWTCRSATCGVFNSEEKSALLVCRCCGSERPTKRLQVNRRKYGER